MSVGTAGEKGEEAVAGGADGAKYTNGEECDAEVSRGGESAGANETETRSVDSRHGDLRLRNS